MGRKWNEKYAERVRVKAEGIDNPTPIHHCPKCKEYLFADKYHKSYNFCIYCGESLKGKKLPFKKI